MFTAILDNVANARTRDEKYAVLQLADKANVPIRRLLSIIMNPRNSFGFKHYLRGQGVLDLDAEVFNVLENLMDKDISAPVRRIIYERYIQSLTPRAANWFHAIVSKQLRLGISTVQINKLWPGTVATFDVMLAQPVQWSKVEFPCVATTKLDGLRCVYRNGTFYSRRGHIFTGLDRLKEALVGRPTLDCELIIPGADFYVASGKIRSSRTTDAARLYVLEAPDQPHAAFQDRIYSAIEGLPLGLVRAVPCVECNNMTEVKSAFASALDGGYEGIVIRPHEYQYASTRSPHWYKVKDAMTSDLTIVDYIEGTGKHKGRLGAFVCKGEGRSVRVGTGFTDAQREDFWKRRAKLVGTTIEVISHEVTSYGSLREPRFVRLRIDK